MVGAGRSVNTAVLYVYTAVPLCTQPYNYKDQIRLAI